ncbi:hypothetical protein F751_3064 [Auxenochlorella protothecoides]|uniref:Uncharacterized protein n=1 Tax=Auxenochlorella protothecoides TaxID=3075 RepID=A0A087SF42_AUXPR|nr:hypothetical protein F751_3064 [Auxenochlorella protothecoides]KFM24346.1 hypothetical protein F751_3064 [Auxenochlorella protothecoides]
MHTSPRHTCPVSAHWRGGGEFTLDLQGQQAGRAIVNRFIQPRRQNGSIRSSIHIHAAQVYMHGASDLVTS